MASSGASAKFNVNLQTTNNIYINNNTPPSSTQTGGPKQGQPKAMMTLQSLQPLPPDTVLATQGIGLGKQATPANQFVSSDMYFANSASAQASQSHAKSHTPSHSNAQATQAQEGEDNVSRIMQQSSKTKRFKQSTNTDLAS